MKVIGIKRPPVDVEQWVDFVIAAAAHRSGNAGHAKFGESLIHRYFVSLPERYADDPAASAYFDDMLCAVAAAIRGFSVAREAFQTNVASIRASKEAELKRAERLDSLSPLAKDGVWGKVAVSVAALGLWGPIQSGFKGRFAAEPLGWLIAAALAVTAAVIALTLIVHWLQGDTLRRVERAFPGDVNAHWEERSLADYRKVLERFVPIAFRVTDLHYPAASSKVPDAGELSEMLDRHFAFLPKDAVRDPRPPVP